MEARVWLQCAVTGLEQALETVAACSLHTRGVVVVLLFHGLVPDLLDANSFLEIGVSLESQTAVPGGLFDAVVLKSQRDNSSSAPVHAGESRDSFPSMRVTCTEILVGEEDVDLSMIVQIQLSKRPEASVDFWRSASIKGYPC